MENNVYSLLQRFNCQMEAVKNIIRKIKPLIEPLTQETEEMPNSYWDQKQQSENRNMLKNINKILIELNEHFDFLKDQKQKAENRNMLKNINEILIELNEHFSFLKNHEIKKDLENYWIYLQKKKKDIKEMEKNTEYYMTNYKKGHYDKLLLEIYKQSFDTKNFFDSNKNLLDRPQKDRKWNTLIEVIYQPDSFLKNFKSIHYLKLRTIYESLDGYIADFVYKTNFYKKKSEQI